VASGGVHAIAGFALGSRVRSVPVALAIGVASHALLDAMPHHDYRTFAAHAADGAASLACIAALARRTPSASRRAAVAGAIGAIVPDVETILLVLGVVGKEAMVFPSHTGLIPHGRTGSLGTCVAYGAVAGASWLLVTARRRRAASYPAAP
jgi:hypothetical protein